MVAAFKYANIHTDGQVINMGLTNKKEEQLRAMPYIQSTVRKSKDGTLLIHRTTITHIKPVAYYEAVLTGKIKEEDLLEV
jgi:hypothetical protein